MNLQALCRGSGSDYSLQTLQLVTTESTLNIKSIVSFHPYRSMPSQRRRVCLLFRQPVSWATLIRFLTDCIREPASKKLSRSKPYPNSRLQQSGSCTSFRKKFVTNRPFCLIPHGHQEQVWRKRICRVALRGRLPGSWRKKSWQKKSLERQDAALYYQIVPRSGDNLLLGFTIGPVIGSRTRISRQKPSLGSWTTWSAKSRT